MDALVLIVDDHADTREGYETYLKFIGAKVLTAATGAEGIAAALDHTPDVIVMDSHMPGMSGREAIGKLKADKRTEGIPIIGLTGEHRDHAESAYDRFLLKPCTPDQLATAIRDLLPASKRAKPAAEARPS